MADSMSISYKVYLEDGADSTEVRRFGIDRSLAFKFSFLREKLQKVFPLLQKKYFNVSWKDQEGDIVMISSDEELTLALSEMNTEVKKLYVAVKSDENLVPCVEMAEMERPAEGPAVHEGVTCDGCKKRIFGFRYKCAVCPDFDLCSTCEGLGLHDEHFMIRISKPIKWRPTYSRRLAHHMAKWSRLAETHRHHHQRRTSNVKCSSGQPVNERNQQFMYNRSYSEHPGWLEYLCSQLAEWVNLPGEVEMFPKASDTAYAPETTAVPGGTPKPSSAAESAKEPQETETPESSHQPRDLTYLQNVGESVAALLSPLGIDVEIQVKDKNQKQAAEKQVTPQASAQVKEEQTAMAREVLKVAQPRETDMAASEEMVKTAKHREAEMAAVASVSEPMEVSPEDPSAPPEFLPTESEGWIYLLPDNAYSTNPEISRIVDERLAKYNTAEPKLSLEAEEALKTARRQLGLELEPTDPKIAKALKQLLEMGFVNKGGWLTQLIHMKGGNVEKVLDALLPTLK